MQLENPLDVTENCRYSLMCRHVCPVGVVTHREATTPHGWALLIASVRRGLAAWNDETVDVLYQCADCGLCQSNCATNQPLPTAIVAAREWVVGLGLTPSTVQEVAERLAAWGNPYGEHGTWSMEHGTAANGDWQMANETAISTDDRKATDSPLQSSDSSAAGQDEDAVALWVGDAGTYLSPRTVTAAEALLAAVGIRAVRVGIGRNSGQLASSLGLRQTAEMLAQAAIDEIAATGARRVVVLSPGDGYTLTQLYDERLGLSLPEGVAVVGLPALLAQAVTQGDLALRPVGFNSPYTYVEPSHAVRVAEWGDGPRELLKVIYRDGFPGTFHGGVPAGELFWRQQRAHPAGDGALAFTHPELAAQLTRARLEDAAQTGAKTIISEDPATVAQLRLYAGEYGLEVAGLYELLAAAL